MLVHLPAVRTFFTMAAWETAYGRRRHWQVDNDPHSSIARWTTALFRDLWAAEPRPTTRAHQVMLLQQIGQCCPAFLRIWGPQFGFMWKQEDAFEFVQQFLNVLLQDVNCVEAAGWAPFHRDFEEHLPDNQLEALLQQFKTMFLRFHSSDLQEEFQVLVTLSTGYVLTPFVFLRFTGLHPDLGVLFC